MYSRHIVSRYVGAHNTCFMKLIENFDLSKCTTFHVPARARYYVEYSSVDELRELLAMPVLKDLPVLHMGGGSNLLFTRDFNGVVMHSAIKGIIFSDVTDDGDLIATAGAGERWDTFVERSCEAGYNGLENLSLIPGSVGAAAVQNIGAYGIEFADRVHGVHVYDTVEHRERLLSPGMLDYGYRQSVFKHDDVAGRYIVTAVSVSLTTRPEFHLEYGPLKELGGIDRLSAMDVRRRVVDVRRAKLPDPDVEGNAGSFFKNPVVEAGQFADLISRYPDMPYYPLPDGAVKLPAGWLIEHSGMKGASVGGAVVYEKQCLVIVNRGDATSSDVVLLSRRVQDEVRAHFGIELYPEVIFVK